MKRSTTISLALIAAMATACGSPSSNCDNRKNPPDPNCRTARGGGAGVIYPYNAARSGAMSGSTPAARGSSPVAGEAARGATSTVSRGGFGTSFAGHGSFGG
jgi:uncharacterized protein YgiB involved in biofilm formation